MRVLRSVCNREKQTRLVLPCRCQDFFKTIGFFETRAPGSQVGLQVTKQLRVTLNFCPPVSTSPVLGLQLCAPPPPHPVLGSVGDWTQALACQASMLSAESQPQPLCIFYWSGRALGAHWPVILATYTSLSLSPSLRPPIYMGLGEDPVFESKYLEMWAVALFFRVLLSSFFWCKNWSPESLLDALKHQDQEVIMLLWGGDL